MGVIVQIADADKSPTKRPTPRFMPGAGVVADASLKAAHGATQAETVRDLGSAPAQERKGRKERKLWLHQSLRHLSHLRHLVLADCTSSLPRRLESSSVPSLVLSPPNPLCWASAGAP